MELIISDYYSRLQTNGRLVMKQNGAKLQVPAVQFIGISRHWLNVIWMLQKRWSRSDARFWNEDLRTSYDAVLASYASSSVNCSLGLSSRRNNPTCMRHLVYHRGLAERGRYRCRGARKHIPAPRMKRARSVSPFLRLSRGPRILVGKATSDSVLSSFEESSLAHILRHVDSLHDPLELPRVEIRKFTLTLIGTAIVPLPFATQSLTQSLPHTAQILRIVADIPESYLNQRSRAGRQVKQLPAEPCVNGDRVSVWELRKSVVNQSNALGERATGITRSG
ncbi:hypothetical protein DFH09DRAFT_1414229 [Mycena vulgaris]|nr:hypothetical protein DFH09DRAFT_1414229 [Mycena vulgaris]